MAALYVSCSDVPIVGTWLCAPQQACSSVGVGRSALSSTGNCVCVLAHTSYLFDLCFRNVGMWVYVNAVDVRRLASQLRCCSWLSAWSCTQTLTTRSIIFKLMKYVSYIRINRVITFLVATLLASVYELTVSFLCMLCHVGCHACMPRKVIAWVLWSAAILFLFDITFVEPVRNTAWLVITLALPVSVD